MSLEEALRDLARALAEADEGCDRAAGLRAARRVLMSRCLALLEVQLPVQPSIVALLKLAAATPQQPARRSCAVLVVHALAVRGLVPVAAAPNICALLEAGLRDVLLRCGYKFAGSLEEKMQTVERLHACISELLQPLEPTFPSWIQGLHAG